MQIPENDINFETFLLFISELKDNISKRPDISNYEEIHFEDKNRKANCESIGLLIEIDNKIIEFLKFIKKSIR